MVLLDGQLLIEAVYHPKVSPDTHAGLDVGMLVARLTCRLYRSPVCISHGAMHDTASFNTHEGLAEHAADETVVAANATQAKQRCELQEQLKMHVINAS